MPMWTPSIDYIALSEKLKKHVDTSHDIKFGVYNASRGDTDMNYATETLFVVTMVSAKDRSILLDELVVAPTQEDAKFRAGIDLILRDKGLEPKDVTIFVNTMGQVKVEDK